MAFEHHGRNLAPEDPGYFGIAMRAIQPPEKRYLFFGPPRAHANDFFLVVSCSSRQFPTPFNANSTNPSLGTCFYSVTFLQLYFNDQFEIYSFNRFLSGDLPKRMWNDRTSSRFTIKLLRWYKVYRRELPWRSSATPYKIWLSEIMLQQTQVKAMIPYYDRFVRRFPDIESLAEADENEVLSYWSGLGYYNRARNLHRAARQIIELHGSFPSDFSAVLALPGVGRYTAGAICSIAFNQPCPIVDGNIRRVLSRLHAVGRSVPDSYFWSIMSSWVPRCDPASFNQAMMELGALICVPQNPKCPQCPVRVLCKAHRFGITARIPVMRRKPACRKVKLVILVMESNRAILLRRNPDSSLIPGDWGLPWRAVTGKDSSRMAIAKSCREILGTDMALKSCGRIRHSITTNQITALGFYGKAGSGIQKSLTEKEFLWVPASSVNKYLTSSLFHKVLAKAACHPVRTQRTG
jgi:A/G-specific adenine glycosylase